MKAILITFTAHLILSLPSLMIQLEFQCDHVATDSSGRRLHATARFFEAERRGGFGHGYRQLTVRPVRSCQRQGRRKNPVIGQGDYRYECHHGWGELPGSIHWFETHGVAVDKAGLIYIKHRAGGEKPKSAKDAQDTIVVFDPQGKFVRSFGKEYHGGGHGIDIREENGQEFLYLCCMFPVNLVVKTDLKGEVVWIKETPTEPHVYDKKGTPYSPTNVAFAPDGGFYVGDGYGSNYIHQYDKDARWVRTFGGTGEGPGQFKTPHGLWLDNRPGTSHSSSSPIGPTPGFSISHSTASPRASTAKSAFLLTSTSGATCCSCPTCTLASRSSTKTTR